MGKLENKRKISLVSSDKFCLPEKLGGLHIKECRVWIIASIGKLL